MANQNLILHLLITARDEASALLGGLHTRISDLGERAAKAAKAGFAALAAAIVAAFTGGVASAVDFETVMARIRVAGVNNANDLERLAAAARKLGAETGAGAVPAAEALENLVKAGLSANDAIAVLPNVIHLAQGQMMGMSDAADLVVNSVNAFGLSFQDSKTVVDVFAAGANAATTSVKDLRQGIENVGLAARTGGLSLQETIAVLNTLKQSGQGASEAGTALNAMLTELGNASSPVRAALLNAGVATGDFNTALAKLAEGGPVTTQILNAFSDTARTAAGTLANGLPFYQDQVKQLNDIKVSAADGANIMGGTFAESLKALNATWSELWQTLAAPILPPLTEAFKAATAFITENKQAIVDWISTGLSPLTQAVDGYRLAWATLKGDQEGAAKIQQQIEERTAAIGRVLSLTSGEFQKHTEQIKQNTAAGEAANTEGKKTTSTLEEQATQLQKTQQALAEHETAVQATRVAWEEAKAAYQHAIDSGQNLDTAVTALAQRSREYDAALKGQAQAQDAARTATQSASAATQSASTATQSASTATKNHTVDLGALKSAYEQQAAEVRRLTEARKTEHATDQQVANAQLKLRRVADDYTSAAKGQVTAVEQLEKKQKAETATAEASVQAKIAQQQANLARAKALGDEYGAAQANIEIAKIEMQQAKDAVRTKTEQLTQSAALLEAKKREYALTLANNPAQQVEIYQLQQTVEQKKAETATAEAGLSVKKAELELRQRLALTTNQNTNTTQQNTDTTQQNTEATKQNAEENARGSDALRSLIQVYASVREGMSKLSEAAARYYDVQYALRQELFQLSSASSSVQSIQNVSNAMAALAAMSDKAGAEMAGFRKELADAQATIRQGEAEFARATTSFAMSSANMAIAAGKTREEFYKQKIEITLLREQIDEMGTAGLRSGGNVRGALERLRKETEDASTSFNLLAQQDLDRLGKSIDDATKRLEEFKKEASDAQQRLAQLDEELAREQGDTRRADLLRQQIEYQQQLAEIQHHLQQAEAAHNNELIRLYQEQISRLNELNDLRIRNIEAENKKPTTKPETKPPPKPAEPEPKPKSEPKPEPSSPVFTLNLVLGSKSLTATTTTNPSDFLSAVQTAQRSAL